MASEGLGAPRPSWAGEATAIPVLCGCNCFSSSLSLPPSLFACLCLLSGHLSVCLSHLRAFSLTYPVSAATALGAPTFRLPSPAPGPAAFSLSAPGGRCTPASPCPKQRTGRGPSWPIGSYLTGLSDRWASKAKTPGWGWTHSWAQTCLSLLVSSRALPLSLA